MTKNTCIIVIRAFTESFCNWVHSILCGNRKLKYTLGKSNDIQNKRVKRILNHDFTNVSKINKFTITLRTSDVDDFCLFWSTCMCAVSLGNGLCLGHASTEYIHFFLNFYNSVGMGNNNGYE